MKGVGLEKEKCVWGELSEEISPLPSSLELDPAGVSQVEGRFREQTGDGVGVPTSLNQEGFSDVLLTDLRRLECGGV